ncbi:MAG: family 20 glycosylhydrolase [Victivallales bacterium]|jgi:hypothetical protein
MFKLRAVQLDLARQYERMDYIRSFIDFSSDWNYNAIFLYLEGRVKTNNFSFFPPELSYDEKDIREIVAYAQVKGIEIVPIISTLGHCEHFLESPEFSRLAELREGIQGRFSDFKHVLCPSLEETYDFLQSYLLEVSEFFPSEFFHVGCDEVWDIGYCSLCRKRIENGETQGDIFASHLGKLHSLVTGRLGKKMIIWDDMYEFYMDKIDCLPRDTVLCCWHYDGLVEEPESHFQNKKKEDKFEKYEGLGFKYIFAPADKILRNTETFTAYSRKYNPIGGLLTLWGKTRTSMMETYPAIAFAGKLWSSDKWADSRKILRDSIGDLFGISNSAFINAVISVKNFEQLSERNVSGDFLRGPLNDWEHERAASLNVLEEILSIYRCEICNPLASDILDDILLYIRRAKLQFSMRSFASTLLDPRLNGNERAGTEDKLKTFIIEVDHIISERKKQWNKFRKGISSSESDIFYGKFRENLLRLVETPAPPLLLTVYFFLPDINSAQNTLISIRYSGNNNWEKIREGVLKPLNCQSSPFYRISFPLESKLKPESVKIESWGYGGQGLTYLEIQGRNNSYVPSKIESTEGIVENPENILQNDLQWCFLGERNTEKSYMNLKSAEKRHYLVVKFA